MAKTEPQRQIPPSGTEFPGDGDTQNGEPRRRLTGLARLFRYRMIMPIARGRHDGVPTARGTAIGLAFGLTPTVGIQMPMIAIFWALAKWLRPKWKFNLIVAFAWTWPTNILTAPAYYYLCLITGRLMMGDTTELSFSDFRAHIHGVLAQDAGFFESLWVYTVEIFRVWGVPLFIGSIPWAVAGTWAGYVLTLRFIAAFRDQQRRQAHRRHERLAHKHALERRRGENRSDPQ